MKTENPMLTISNKHLLHRKDQERAYIKGELIDSAYLMDPSKPRTDHSPNLSSFKDRKASPVKKMQKMMSALVAARTKADDTNAKIAIVDVYKEKYNCKLVLKFV